MFEAGRHRARFGMSARERTAEVLAPLVTTGVAVQAGEQDSHVVVTGNAVLLLGSSDYWPRTKQLHALEREVADWFSRDGLHAHLCTPIWVVWHGKPRLHRTRSTRVVHGTLLRAALSDSLPLHPADPQVLDSLVRMSLR